MGKILTISVLAVAMITGSVYAKGGVGNRGNGSNISRAEKRQKGGVVQKRNTAARLKALDKNGDNNISRDEASKKLDRRFEKIDADGNSSLSADELKSLKKKERSQNETSQQPAMTDSKSGK